MQTLDMIRPGNVVSITTLSDPDRVLVGTVAIVDLVGVAIRIDDVLTFVPYSAVETLTVGNQ